MEEFAKKIYPASLPAGRRLPVHGNIQQPVKKPEGLKTVPGVNYCGGRYLDRGEPLHRGLEIRSISPVLARVVALFAIVGVRPHPRDVVHARGWKDCPHLLVDSWALQEAPTREQIPWAGPLLEARARHAHSDVDLLGFPEEGVGPDSPTNVFERCKPGALFSLRTTIQGPEEHMSRPVIVGKEPANETDRRI